MKYWIVDGETSIKNRGDAAVGDMAASPYCADNKLVLLGARQGTNNFVINNTAYSTLPDFLTTALRECVLLIGHNIGFDLKYIAKTWPATWAQALPNIYIWDTQQVAYLLSGQTHMYPSLDELCAEIGRPLKDDKIKEYWDNGVDTELIPMGELLPYLEGDLENTDAVFRHQYEIVTKNKALFNLVKVKMDDILCTVMMEDNGMEFDLMTAHSLAAANDLKIAISELMAADLAAGHFIEGFNFNPMSNEHVSLMMFGGEYKQRESVPVLDEHGNEVRYKTGARKGEVKTRQEDVMYTTAGMGLTPVGAPKKNGIYSVADDVLQQYAGVPFVQYIKTIRELTKENETYYRGYSSLVWPDGRIHPSINHCSTRTGRQSCTKPNLQNVTREE